MGCGIVAHVSASRSRDFVEMIVIPFRVLAGASDSIVPLEELKVALRASKLPNFVRLWDARRTATPSRAAMLGDLNAAGCSGWIWCRAICLRVGDHSWLEAGGVGGWALDPSNSRSVLVLPSYVYRSLRGVGLAQDRSNTPPLCRVHLTK
jgi:hypothetical protein